MSYQSRAFPSSTVALLIRMGDEDTKNTERNDLFSSSCFPAEKRYIYTESLSICVFPDATRELYHTGLFKAGTAILRPDHGGHKRRGQTVRTEIYLDCIIFKHSILKKRRE